MPVPENPPETQGRDRAHAVVDFLWDKVHISTGALILIAISFLFTAAVWKIDSNDSARFGHFQTGVCAFVGGVNQGMGATRVRIIASAKRDEKQANAEQHIADVWRYALAKEPRRTPRSQRNLVRRLIHSQEVLAMQDRAGARDLRRQLAQVGDIKIQGC